MAKPTELPEFDKNETDIDPTDTARKDNGFIVTGGVPEKPSYKLFNYLLNQNYKWFKYFDEREQTVTHNMAADANYTLTAAQNSFGRFIITDTGVVLTTSRDIIIDDKQRQFLVQNDTAQTLTFKTNAGTGIGINAGAGGNLYCDGTDVIEVPGGGDPTLLAEYEVTGSAVTTIDFTGLDINTHKSYRVEIEANNPTITESHIRVFVNNDTTLTSYYTQLFTIDTAVTSPVRVNYPRIGYVYDTNDESYVILDVGLSDGIFHGLAKCASGSGSNTELVFASVKKTATVTNITQLTFATDIANAFGVGSKIRIYRGDL